MVLLYFSPAFPTVIVSSGKFSPTNRNCGTSGPSFLDIPISFHLRACVKYISSAASAAASAYRVPRSRESVGLTCSVGRTDGKRYGTTCVRIWGKGERAAIWEEVENLFVGFPPHNLRVQ